MPTFLERLLKWIRYASANPRVRRVFLALSCMFLGGLFYALVIDRTELEPIEKLGVFLSAIAALLASALVILDRIFSLELNDKRLRLAERELDSADPETLASVVATKVSARLHDPSVLPDSIYQDRTQHYRREKLFLAGVFLDVLGRRVQYLKARVDAPIRVIIDSGTTLAPIFDKLGREAAEQPSHWSDGIEIVTNNIRGVQLLLNYRYSAATPGYPGSGTHSRHANISVACSVLPGRILAAYQAIADEHTLKALRTLGRARGYNICVTTGNYLLFDPRSDQVLPIARTLHHPHVKVALYHCAREVYNVAPLGKVLITRLGESLWELLERFNRDLGYDTGKDDPELEAYQLVEPGLLRPEVVERGGHTVEAWVKKSILVTTSRGRDTLFSGHSRLLRRSLRRFEPATDETPLDGPYVWTEEFRERDIALEDQVELEIPHQNLRDLRGDYFSL